MFTKIHSTLAHLPINNILDAVVEAFGEGHTPIITSEVASGKTLLVPAAIANALDEVVYVLEPNRNLANNAAETIIRILGDNKSNFVGCLNSNRHDDRSYTHENNRVVFTTVGFALASGLISSEANIIFDEAHETSIDLSLAKAIVNNRIENGETVRTAILSATLDVENEMEFWGSEAEHFTTQGVSFGVTHLHRPAATISESVIELITEHNSTGILVFVEGKEEINETCSELHSNLVMLFGTDDDFEISRIHGGSNTQERDDALCDPTKKIKILVCTNVMESGITLTWVNGGVSTGMGKILHVNGNIHRLVTEDLPAWRIKQQEGRTGRFGPGVFILNGKLDVKSRPNMNKPDIVRLPLEELVMHCAKLPNVQLEELKFTAAETPNYSALQKAIRTLIQYGLICRTDIGSLELTEAGRWSEHIPVSYQGSVACCEAKLLESISVAIPLIALMEVGDLRFDHRHRLNGAIWEGSDLISQVYSVAQFIRARENSEQSFREMAEDWNFNIKKYRAFIKMISILEQSLDMEANLEVYLTEDPVVRRKLDQVLRQIIFRSMINSRYLSEYRSVSINPIGSFDYSVFGSATLSNSSVCNYMGLYDVLFVTGTIRQITPKQGFPFNVVENITMFKQEDVEYLKNRWGMNIIDPEGRFISESKSEFFNPRPKKPIEVEPEEPEMGSFGSLLASVLYK